MAIMTTKAPQTWDVQGCSEEGEAETTRVSLYQNSEWTPELADELFRYQVTRILVEAGVVCDDDGFDDPREAEEWARKLAEDSRSEYLAREFERREALAEALEALVRDAAEGSAEEAAIEALAGLIGKGKAASVVAALTAAGLM